MLQLTTRDWARVAFAECNQVIFLDNTSLKYKTDLFYSEQDIKLFKLETAFLVNKLKNSTPDVYFDPKYQLDTTDIMGLEK